MFPSLKPYGIRITSSLLRRRICLSADSDTNNVSFGILKADSKGQQILSLQMIVIFTFFFGFFFLHLTIIFFLIHSPCFLRIYHVFFLVLFLPCFFFHFFGFSFYFVSFLFICLNRSKIKSRLTHS